MLSPRINRSLVCLALLCAALPFTQAQGSDWSLGSLMNLLKQNGSMKARFVESKHVKVLDAPVESSGELSYIAPHRLEKKILKPRAEIMVLEGDVLSMERGNTKRSMNLSDHPEIGAMVQSMRAALGGDKAAMEKYFDASLSGTRQRWRLSLTPRSTKAMTGLRQIQMVGDDNYVHTIEVWLRDGDWSVMTIERPMDAR